MSNFKEPWEENYDTLKLIGSPISPTPSSDKQSLISCHKNYRSGSSIPYFKTVIQQRGNYEKPKSAEYITLNPHSKPLQWGFSSSDSNLSGDPSSRLSHFTNSSSKLLQHLLRNSISKFSEMDCKSSSTLNSSRKSTGCKQEPLKIEKYLEIGSRNEFFNLNTNLKLQKSLQVDNKCINKNDLENLKVLSGLSEEKTVKFSEHLCYNEPLRLAWWASKSDSQNNSEHHHSDSFPDKNLCHRKASPYHSYRKTYQLCLKSDFKEKHSCQQSQKPSGKANILELEAQTTNPEIKSNNDVKTFNSVSDTELLDSREKCKETFQKHPENLSVEKDNKLEKILNSKIESLPTCQPNLEFEDRHLENSFFEKLKTTTQSFSKETSEEVKPKMDEDELQHDCTHQKVDLTDSAYEEIVHLLQTLDEEDSESMNLKDKEDTALPIPELDAHSSEKIDYLSAVSSYLEEIETEDDNFNLNYDSKRNWNSKNIVSPRLEELLNKNSIELAHEVFSLKIQIEDQKKGIKLLRDTLAEMKEAKKSDELEHQEALHKATAEAETLVQRHQKFIKQLLNEKKNLNDTVSKLVQDLKLGEEKYKKNIKAIEEKHLIEIKRAKEAQAVADKIKREKWMENKTKKIKEMTVKGLEPELSRMAAQQQEEMTELRNLHKAEIEAVELRAARRNSELMDELRAELTKEKERAIAKEVAALRTALEKEFEEEKNKLQRYCQTLKERIRKQEERLSNQELEFQQRLIDYKQEEERNKQIIIRNHQENLEEIKRQHLLEQRNLRESEEANKQILLNNFKKEQALKFLEKEAEIHQQYKKERDKEIEMVIEALEKESAQIQTELNTANEGRLKRLKDKMETEIKELEASEATLKVKLSEAKSKLSEKEDTIAELNSEIRRLQTELNFFKKSCEEMSSEKAKLKEIIREEFENTMSGLIKEKENAEKEITILKELHTKELAKKDQLNLQNKYEMQKELTRVYNRIKTAVSKKEKVIEALREENGAVNQKCRQLEFLLDQQRRNLLLQ